MMRGIKKIALALGIIGATVIPAVVNVKPAAAANSWQYAAKCVYWPAGVGNWAVTPYWKIKFGTNWWQPYFVADAAQNRSNYSWISSYYSLGLGDIRRNGYGAFDRYHPQPVYWNAVNYMNLNTGEAEPYWYETSQPMDNDLAYSNRFLTAPENTRTIAFSANVLNCNNKNASGQPTWYGSW